jgi:hypothetical protein
MATAEGQKTWSQYGAHVVTRPTPEVVGINRDLISTSSAQLLQHASKAWTGGIRETSCMHSVYRDRPAGLQPRDVLTHSFHDVDEQGVSLVSYKNGFVDGIIRAFQQDLHLVLRPDDVWLAIVVQFSFYVNGHAEEMRKFFVAHEGRRKLVVRTGSPSPLSVDFGVIAKTFKSLIQDNVVDPELTSWILPDFSTTTDEDITTTTVAMMATTKRYFEFIAMGGCGFPSVTLLGERADWVKLHAKVERLRTYGGELADWSKLLTKVVGKMVETFDQPDRQATKDFWMRAVHQAGRDGSLTVETLSGWITAFCRWDEEGRTIRQVDEAASTSYGQQHIDRKRFVIDDVAFPIISPKDVPRAATEVPITFLDALTGIRYETTAVAGLVGVKPSASIEGGPYDTFQPRSGYWIVVDEAGPIPADFTLGDNFAMKSI